MFSTEESDDAVWIISVAHHLHMHCRYLDDYGSRGGNRGEIAISMEDQSELHTAVLHIFGESYKRSDNVFCMCFSPSVKMTSNLVVLV